jgi:hypothetical protein
VPGGVFQKLSSPELNSLIVTLSPGVTPETKIAGLFPQNRNFFLNKTENYNCVL